MSDTHWLKWDGQNRYTFNMHTRAKLSKRYYWVVLKNMRVNEASNFLNTVYLWSLMFAFHTFQTIAHLIIVFHANQGELLIE